MLRLPEEADRTLGDAGDITRLMLAHCSDTLVQTPAVRTINLETIPHGRKVRDLARRLYGGVRRHEHTSRRIEDIPVPQETMMDSSSRAFGGQLCLRQHNTGEACRDGEQDSYDKINAVTL